MSAVLYLSQTAGEGGFNPNMPGNNIIEAITAEQDASGAWQVVDRDGAGTVRNTRPATADEATNFAARLNPPAVDPAMANFVATLTTTQRDALSAALAAPPAA